MNHERARQILHTMWSRSRGVEYVKRDWLVLDRLVLDDSGVASALIAFARLREIASRQQSYAIKDWDAFEQALFSTPILRADF